MQYSIHSWADHKIFFLFLYFFPLGYNFCNVHYDIKKGARLELLLFSSVSFSLDVVCISSW